MLCKSWLISAAAVAGLAAAVGSLVVAAPAEEAKPAAAPEFKLPPGWTEADLQACILAGTPGKMHELLAEGVGEWKGKNTMWMAPGSEPVTSDSTSTVSKMLDGRFVKCEMDGEIPGMGPYNGFGIVGFDNVSQKFVSVWLDNHGTGMMTGTGELSEGGKKIEWKYTFNCPVTKKPAVMRQIETITGADSKTLEMYSEDPKIGKEYKMMSISLTRK